LKTAIARILDDGTAPLLRALRQNMHADRRPAQRGVVSAAPRLVFNATDWAEGDRRSGRERASEWS
jgi:hypothetical protein